MSVSSTRYQHPVFMPIHAEGETPILARKAVGTLSLTLLTYDSFIADVIKIAHRCQPAYGCFANAHMLVEASQDEAFTRSVNRANWVTADGVPLRWALRALYGLDQERITGLDVLPSLLSEAARHKLPIYFYGTTPAMLEQCKAFCRDCYPSLIIAGMYSPPFRMLTADEEQEVINNINASGAAIVFVALGCPKQEKWMSAVSSRIHAVLLGVGGALPVTIGAQRRAPVWMQKTGLEWFFRFVQEPRRLVHRYASTNGWFIFYFLKQLYKQRIRPSL